MYRSRAQWALFVTAVLAAGGLLPQLASAQECTDLPRSNLKIYRLTVDQVTEHAATRPEIEGIVTALAGTPSAHPLMAIVDAIDIRVGIVHRVMERPQGYCDAPETILLGLGVARREVFILHEAAHDPCVRGALLTHESEHDRALGKAIHDFFRQHRPQLARQLETLKRQSARDRRGAMQAFEAGLQVVLATMMKEFKEEKIGHVKQAVDSTSRLSALSNACNGRLGELEKISRGKAL